jgi:archaellum component FlaC
MKREMLENLGLDKDIINQIMEQNGKDINTAKADYEAVKQELANTKQELETANNTIKGFEDMNVEDLQKQINTYKESIKQIKADNVAKIKSMVMEQAIDNKFASVPEKYRNLLKLQVNKDKIVVGDDNSITGLEEQFNSIKEQYSDLFQEQQTGLKFGLEQKETANETINKKTEDLASIFGVKM